MDDLKKYARENHVPIIMDDGLKFLLNSIQELNVKRILELGTAIGYSAMEMAKLNPEIKILTIEKKKDMYDQAIENIKSKNLQDQIECLNMNIDDFDTKLKFDLIFVDAAKAQYKKYLEKFEKNLEKEGIFFFDNLSFHGLVKDPNLCNNRNTRQLVKKIAKFNQEVLNDSKYETQFFPEIGDGVMILKIKGE